MITFPKKNIGLDNKYSVSTSSPSTENHINEKEKTKDRDILRSSKTPALGVSDPLKRNVASREATEAKASPLTLAPPLPAKIFGHSIQNSNEFHRWELAQQEVYSAASFIAFRSRWDRGQEKSALAADFLSSHCEGPPPQSNTSNHQMQTTIYSYLTSNHTVLIFFPGETPFEIDIHALKERDPKGYFLKMLFFIDPYSAPIDMEQAEAKMAVVAALHFNVFGFPGTEKAKEMLSALPEDQRKQGMQRVLSSAIEKQNLDLVSLMLEWGADANQWSGEPPESPIRLAQKLSNQEFTSLLLAHGADLDAGKYEPIWWV